MEPHHPGTRNFQTLNKRSLDERLQLTSTNYSVGDNIGCGAYGVVCTAVDLRDGERVAIKKIPHIFDNLILAKRTYREIMILQHFKHENIIHIRELLTTRGGASDFADVCIVFDLMETDLHQLIRSKQELSDEHIRYFLYQLLRGLKYIHSANILHRDLKPSNLLVNENCDLKIGDFGMARPTLSSEQNHSLLMTQYVATRWYRSPELMLFRQQYTAAVDVWSVGCIFAEMLGRKPIFPGKNLLSQIMLVIGVLGSPTDEFISMAHTERIKDFLTKLENKSAVPLGQLFPTAGPKALRLLEKLLTFDPRQRMTVDDALKDLYLNKYHDPDDEPICQPTFGFEFEKQDLDEAQLRALIYKELQHDPVLAPLPPSNLTSAMTQIGLDEIATTNSVSTYVVLDNVRLQDVEMPSAKNSPELICADTLQDMTRLTIVEQQSGNEQQQSVTVGIGQQSVAVGTVQQSVAGNTFQQSVAVGTVQNQQYVAVGTEQQSVAVGTDRLGTECTNTTNRTPAPLTEVKSNVDSQLLRTENTAHFTLVPDYGKSCKNVDYAVGGVTVARMQSWKFKPHEAQAGQGSGGGKEKTRKRVYRRAKNAVPVSTSATRGVGCTGAPVNVKEALRAVLLSETRDFRTKAAKLKAKCGKSDSDPSKKELLYPRTATNGSSLLLTDEDKGLLSRWIKMQKGGDGSNPVGRGTGFNDVALAPFQPFNASALQQACVEIRPKIALSQSTDRKLKPNGQLLDMKVTENSLKLLSNGGDRVSVCTVYTSNSSVIFANGSITNVTLSNTCQACLLNKSDTLFGNVFICQCSNTTLLASHPADVPIALNDKSTVASVQNSLLVKSPAANNFSDLASASLSDCDMDSGKLSGLVKAFLPSSFDDATLVELEDNVVWDYSVDRFENALTLSEICVQGTTDFKSIFEGIKTANSVNYTSVDLSSNDADWYGSVVPETRIDVNLLVPTTGSFGSGYGVGLDLDEILSEEPAEDYSFLGEESAALLNRWIGLQQDSQMLEGEDLETILMHGVENNIR